MTSGENHDDYYMCISHVELHCSFIDDYHVAGVSVTEVQDKDVIGFAIEANEKTCDTAKTTYILF